MHGPKDWPWEGSTQTVGSNALMEEVKSNVTISTIKMCILFLKITIEKVLTVCIVEFVLDFL